MHRENVESYFQGDPSLEEETEKVCGIKIRGVQAMDKGEWR